MERIPRAEGESYINPVIPSNGVDRYDVDTRYEINPDAATGTQVTLMRCMLPDRLRPYKDVLTEEAQGHIFLKWVQRYGDYFGIMCEELGGDDNLLSHIKNQRIEEAEKGKTTLSDAEITKMATFLEDAAIEAKKSPLLRDDEIDHIVAQYRH